VTYILELFLLAWHRPRKYRRLRPNRRSL